MENKELVERTLLAISEADRLGFTNTRDALIEIAHKLFATDQSIDAGSVLAWKALDFCAH
tara:strand:+ start:227 stop:406 length:180 start_codon:yes stop_codon:yes gene_type:complete